MNKNVVICSHRNTTKNIDLCVSSGENNKALDDQCSLFDLLGLNMEHSYRVYFKY